MVRARAERRRQFFDRLAAPQAQHICANRKNWPLAEMKKVMREHLDPTLGEATARLKGDWRADIGAYERIHTQILGMADMLSAGIIRQFPAKFK
jgi:hypothetical protein